LFNSNPAPLSGVLAIGYFLHPFVIPIIRETSTPSKAESSISYGYFLVFLTNFMIGLFGLFGFMGSSFNNYSKVSDVNNWPIAQNCVTQFDSKDIWAFLINIVLLGFCSSCYPLVHSFI